MKKINLIFDGTHYSIGALEFVNELSKIDPIIVTGVFVPIVNYASYITSYTTGVAGPEFLPLLDKNYKQIILNNIRKFKDYCATHNIICNVHNEKFDFALPELKKESRYADLLVIGSETFFKNDSDQISNYLKEALHQSECSVVVVPEKFSFPEMNILAYDGSESSVYAIKQFTYLFPMLCYHITKLVYVSDKENDIPDKAMLEEFLKCHFEKVDYLHLKLNPKKLFNTWMSEEKGAVLISGSFGRSSVSNIFSKSFVEDIINAHQVIIFISHL